MIQFKNAIERYGKIILNEMKESNIKCWIAGGALRDYFMGVSVKTDYDIFFPNEIEYDKARLYFKAKECAIKWESDNGMKIVYNDKTFDLVKKFFATPQETIDAFDFTVSMFAVDHDKIYHGETTFIDLAKRQLMINKITFPASSLSRAFRYYGKGFKMCLGEMKKLTEAIQGMPKPKEEEKEENKDASSGELGTFFVGID
jgi:hypothetical protein